MPEQRPLEELVDALHRWVEAHRDPMVGDLQRLLRIPSVESETAGPGQPFGPEVARALECALDIAQGLGLRTKNVDGYAGHAEYGPEDGELVGVLVHVDVVPAGQGWSVDPWGGVLKDGRVYGRGAIDDKGPAVAALYALAAVAGLDGAGEVRLRRRARVIVGADEEKDFRCVNHYFQREPRPALGFSPDAAFPIVYAEKGILNLRIARELPEGGALLRLVGGERPNVVPDRAEALLQAPAGRAADWVEALHRLICEPADPRREASFSIEVLGGDRIRCEARGVAAHGSTPEQGVNAAAELLRLLADLAGLSGSEARVDPSGAAAFLGRRAAGDTLGRGLGIDCEDEISGMLSANLGVLRWEGRRIEATFNIRYPVTAKADELLRRARQTVEPAGFRVEEAHDEPPHHVDAASPLVRTLQEVYAREVGEEPVLLAIGGGTYARSVPGAVAFGPNFPWSDRLAHQKDENIAVDHLLRITKIYAHALLRLML